MKDQNAGKYQRHYKREFAMAQLVLAPYGGTLSWSANDYEAFRFASPGVTLIFYPHKTSAGNHHIRVRDQGSKSKGLAKELMTRLDIAAGHCCTFSGKHRYEDTRPFADRNKIAYGWAHDRVDWNGRVVDGPR